MNKALDDTLTDTTPLPDRGVGPGDEPTAASAPRDVSVPESAAVATEAPPSEGDDVALAEDLKKKIDTLRAAIGTRIVGQERVVDLLLTALLSSGHGLFVGVPGLAKTLLIQTLAEGLGLSFNRIQFTPDLMPSDITGTEVLEENKSTGARVFRFVEGPVFANVLLADEINRTPPKTQAALLQAMQERRVTAGGKTHDLDAPFLVFATQNPIEQEGTYPLPEAQLDRFMFLIDVGYPSEAEEMEIVRQTTGKTAPPIEKVVTQREVLAYQELVRRVPAPDHVIAYAVKLARSTRPDDDAPPAAKTHLSWGAGPRASQSLVVGAKARAALDGRFAATVEDVRDVAVPVLSHRVVVSFAAASAGVRPDDVIAELLKAQDGGKR